MSVFCTNCGAPMDEDTKFCPSCGAKMLPDTEVPNGKDQPSTGINGSSTGFSGTSAQGNSGSYGGYSSSGPGGYQGAGQGSSGSYGSSGRGSYSGSGNVNSGTYGSSGMGGYTGSGQGTSGNYGPAGSGAYSGAGQGPSGSYGSSGSGSYQGQSSSGGYPGGKMGTPGLYSGSSGGNYGGGMQSGNGGGGAKIGLIIGAVALVAVLGLGGFFAFKKFSGASEKEAETTAAVKETVQETKTPKKEDSGKGNVTETTAAAATGDLSKIKLPKGATVKTDAGFWDFVGEYKGEIQMTRMDGYEDMEDVPDEAREAMLELLKAPVECELEIEGDGQWSISWPVMDSSMDFRSNDYDDPKDFTPAEIDALLITSVDKGVYHAKIEKEGEIDDGSTGKMTLHHIGAYCTDGSDRLIAGNFYANIVMQGMDVTIEGDFVVNKTTEDIAKEELEAMNSSSKKKQDTKETEEETKDFKGNVDTDVLGQKAEDLAKKKDKEKEKETEAETKVEIPTVSGGKWKQVGSEWMYEKNKKLVKNSWILHKNVYYYVDENGFMLTDGYTPDGYYVGKDGAWDQKKSKYDKEKGSDKGDELSESEQREIAEDLSTSEDAHALEFDWFYDYVLNNGRDNGRVITDEKLARRITDEQAALNGGWKAFMFTKDGDYGSDGERYLNATVDTKGNKFYVTLNWHYYIDPTSGKTVTETGNTLFRGTYDDLEGTAVCRADDGMIEFDAFYISTDGLTEYAVGTYHWISGEIDQIALARGVL